MRKTPVLFCLAIALSGCVEAGAPSEPPAAATPATSRVFSGNPKAVPFARGLQLFDAVCVSTAPNHFNGATAAMAANNVTVPSPMGTSTLYSVEENLSFQIAGKSGDRRCSMVFGTNTGSRTLASAFVDRFGEKLLSNSGVVAVVDQKTGYLVTFNAAPPIAGQHGVHLVAFDTQPK